MTEPAKKWFKRILEDAAYWLFFALALSLAPLGYAAWRLCKNGNNIQLDGAMFQVIAHGELLLVCVCLLGAIIGDLIRSNTSWGAARLVIGGSSVILFFWSTNGFADVAAAAAQGAEFVRDTSVFVFFGTLGAALGTILLPRDL